MIGVKKEQTEAVFNALVEAAKLDIPGKGSPSCTPLKSRRFRRRKEMKPNVIIPTLILLAAVIYGNSLVDESRPSRQGWQDVSVL